MLPDQILYDGLAEIAYFNIAMKKRFIDHFLGLPEATWC